MMSLMRNGWQRRYIVAEHTRVADNFQYDEKLTPYENLAAAIIRRAIMDAKRIDLGKQSQWDSHYYKSEILENYVF